MFKMQILSALYQSMNLKKLFIFSSVVVGLCILSFVVIGQRKFNIKYSPENIIHLETRSTNDSFGKITTTRGKEQSERWMRFYGETSCNDNPMRDKLLTLLAFWIKFAKDHQIGYVIMWGALLGILRVNDILPWDHDIDILIDYRDVLRLQEIVEKPGTFQIDDGNVHIATVHNLPVQHNLTYDERIRHTCEGEVVTKTTDPCSFNEPLSRILLNWWFIDIYHYYDKGEQLVTIPEGKTFAMNKIDVFPLQNCSIMGLVSLCPKNPSRLLENWYGKGYLDKSQYKCKNGSWQDENGVQPEKDWRL